MDRLSKSTLSLPFSLFALFFGVVMLGSITYLPEEQSIPLFFVLFPATLILAMLGYITGAMSRNSHSSMLGFLVGGGILTTIVIILMLPAF